MTSQTGSLPLFLSLFLLLLAFFIFLNSISTRQSGKSEDVLDSVRASFASVLQGGTGAGVFEGEPGLEADAGLRDGAYEAFSPLLEIARVRDGRDGSPLYMDFREEALFPRDAGGAGDTVPEFHAFAADIAPVLARAVPEHHAEIRLWSGLTATAPAQGQRPKLVGQGLVGQELVEQRLARMAAILIARGVPKAAISIGFRDLPEAGTIRISVDPGRAPADPETGRP